MTPYCLRIQPCSAFGTRPLGDSLLGQLCWAVRNRLGTTRLTQLLDGYTDGHPYCVVSDALPSGYFPRPGLPTHHYRTASADRKALKKRHWLPAQHFHTPVTEWLNHCQAPTDMAGEIPTAHPQPHNTLDRLTGTTGTGEFAPYSMNQWWFGTKLRTPARPSNNPLHPVKLDVIVILDETRLTISELVTLFTDIGQIGFGRDASIGLGKFTVDDTLPTPITLPSQTAATAYLTLAPMAPQGCGFDPNNSYYQPFTRFGRHGDIAAVSPHGPYKTPVLLAQTGAVLTPHHYQPQLFIGQGLGGAGRLSKTIPTTVQQGYAPVLGLCLTPQEAA